MNDILECLATDDYDERLAGAGELTRLGLAAHHLLLASARPSLLRSDKHRYRFPRISRYTLLRMQHCTSRHILARRTRFQPHAFRREIRRATGGDARDAGLMTFHDAQVAKGV